MRAERETDLERTGQSDDEQMGIGGDGQFRGK